MIGLRSGKDVNENPRVLSHHLKAETGGKKTFQTVFGP
jgi:hypothetical protein